MSKPLLLLAAPSHESRDKAAHLRAAAESLGVPARIIVGDRSEVVEAMAGDEAIVLAIACSDALTLVAARLNERHGCGGLSVGLINQLADKATGIPLLSQIFDLPLLPQCLPLTPEDIFGWLWSGPIIVKPTRSSGGWSPRPWGYRRFNSKDHFMRWLREEGLQTPFFAEQRQPQALGPALLQAALDGSCTEGAMLLLTASQMHVIYRSHGYFELTGAGSVDGPRWRRACFHNNAAPDLIENLPHLDRLRRRDPAWGRGIMNVHGIRGPDGLHLIDINLRLTTTWDWVAGVADPTAHRRLLAALLFDAPLDLPLPAPVTVIDLVNGDPRRRIAAVEHLPVPPHILPVRLTAEDCGSPVGGFDKAGVMPCFVTLGADLATCTADAERFRAGIRLHYADEIAR
ncbi:hypothetical protein FNB15_05580 [Ferrovibrio terrae]|uniref:ATP-grasp domain-containing protein n=1 Tax=Ferrovibrio terrae TaxID=2594003 RepID=A0A516GZL5_9PROT|nr:hypothetical protein [Ferrovibrio terrae]QDO96780.1 hypothetical protein FNB15_05580 [Ferrovibrio terrae]